MKVTRPMMTILVVLTILQFALVVGLWIASLFLSYDSSDPVVDAVAVTQLFLLALSVITMLWAQKFIDVTMQKEITRQHGGLLRSRFSWRYWQEYWACNAPYAPRWLDWLSSGVLFSILIVALGVICLLLTGNNPIRTYGSSIRSFTLYSFLNGIMILPVVVSKWRELSQPAASVSPEVRPS
jgi:hypothetical protein